MKAKIFQYITMKRRDWNRFFSLSATIVRTGTFLLGHRITDHPSDVSRYRQLSKTMSIGFICPYRCRANCIPPLLAKPQKGPDMSRMIRGQYKLLDDDRWCWCWVSTVQGIDTQYITFSQSRFLPPDPAANFKSIKSHLFVSVAYIARLHSAYP